MTLRNRPPTISDVAQKANVSIATVSRVLNGTTPVELEKANRVRLAMEELQFVPRHAARVLASRRTNTIGLLMSEISGAFFPPMLKGIEAGAYEAGYNLLIHSTKQEGPSHRPLGEHNTDGLLIFTDSLDHRELHHLHDINFPMVLLHQSPPDSLDIPVITIENKDGAAMLVKHLIEIHGRRRIVFLKGPQGHEDSVWRERGYREALEAHNLGFQPELIAFGGFDEEQAFATIQQMLLDGIEFDAIFAGDDDSAIGAMRALKLAGRLIPRDIAVVGFDDVPFARYLSPPLTTVRAPIEAVGREAVRQLVLLMNSQPAEALTLMRSELIIRESCGCRLPPSNNTQEEFLTSTRR
ncbi:MAG TPA: LacI family DNA-binding transcriptional regulator [Anaerolineales bacterium]|nr:LacI family DNA-binding transcriptional regulator [Anaerolineales bacterium]